MENLLKDKPLPIGEVLENVGYSQTLSEQPNRIIQTPGFQEALADIGLKQALINKGINPEKIAEKIDILLNATDEKGNKDYTAIDKGLKHATSIYGIVDPTEKPKIQNTYNFIFQPENQADIKLLEDKIKARLIQPNV